MRPLQRVYGAGPLHLLGMAGCYLVGVYAAIRLLSDQSLATGGWFLGAAIGHDLVFLPAYLLLDAAVVAVWRRHPTVAGRSWLHHVRWPGAISLLLLLVFGPEIFRFDGPYAGASGLSSAGYLGRWAIVVAVLFGLSAVALLVRLARR